MPIHRGKDSKGPYYQYGETGKKYHYISNDKLSRDKAYEKALKQTQAIKASEGRRGGNKLLDKAKSFVKEKGSDLLDKLKSLVSKNAPPQIKKLLEQNGQYTIKEIQVCREPIQRAVDTLLNAITLGKFEKAKKDLGYDNFFHLYMYIKLSNGYSFRIEKNERVKLTDEQNPGKKECVNVPITKQVTLNEMFASAIARNNSFWLYSSYNNNCQKFVDDMLTGSGLNTPEIRKFVMQDAETLFTKLPGYTKVISDVATGLASVADQVRQGGKRKKYKI